MKTYLSTSGLAYLGWWIILLNTAVGLALGLLAALAGGALAKLGDGLGGGYGIPELAFVLSVLLGLPGLVRGMRALVTHHKDQAVWFLVFLGPLMISFTYIQIAHAIEPCVNGAWDLSSRTNAGMPLCERFGSEVNIHTRFHYLWHILWILPQVGLFAFALKRRPPAIFNKR